MSRPRPRTVAIGALALLLVAAPFVPRGGDDDGALLPSGDQQSASLVPADTAPLGKVTPELQAEIDRVLAEDRKVGRVPVTQSPDQLAAALVRCADFDGQRYCLHTGWTESSERRGPGPVATAARAIAARPAPATTTGDLDELATLRRFARMSPSAREAEERAELVQAARSVAKVWLLRHDIEGVDIPASFLAEHPEAVATSTAQPSGRAGAAGRPEPGRPPRRPPRARRPRRPRRRPPRRAARPATARPSGSRTTRSATRC